MRCNSFIADVIDANGLVVSNKHHSFKLGIVQERCKKKYRKENYCVSLHYTIPTFNDLEKKPFENIVGKGEFAGNQHFLLFRIWFLPYHRQKSSFELHLYYRLQMLSVWFSAAFCCLVKRYREYIYSVAVYQKYLTRWGEFIIFEPL